MRKHLLRKTMTVACAVLALAVNAQGISSEKTSVESLKNFPLSKVSMQRQVSKQFKKTAVLENKVITRASGVSYDTPAGVIAGAQKLQGYVNFLSFNMQENSISQNSFNYLIAPKDSLVGYFNTSTASGTSNWTIPGGDIPTSTDGDIFVTYPNKGTYAFPTLNISGTEYTAPGKIVVDGKGEIALADCLDPGETYDPFCLKYQEGGYPTGSGNEDIEAFGNMFFICKDAVITGVNVYINANPKASNPDNKVKMSIYVPDFTTSEAKLDGTLLATSELKVSEMMADAKSVTGFTAQDGGAFMGMASFKLATPVRVNSSDPFFVSISNIGNDVKGGDSFAIMFDGSTPAFDDPNNLFSWSSFMKAMGTDKNMHWFSLYQSMFADAGTEFFPNGNTNLFICPIISYDPQDLAGGISNATSDVKNKAFAANGTLSLSSEGSNQVGIYTVSGQLVQSVSLNGGNQSVSTSGWAKGVYVVKFANGENVKVVI